MDNERPDPDQLLERLNAEEAKARRGKLKIFSAPRLASARLTPC